MAGGTSPDPHPSVARAVGGARVSSVVLVSALLALVASLCLQPVTESDLFFRIKVGQEILAHRHLMERNLFSFTAPDHPDLDLAWMFEVIVAVAYRVGSFPLVVIVKTALVAAAIGIAFVACRRRGASPLAAVLTLAGASFIMRDRMVERPHVVSFVGEAVVMAALARIRRPWSWGRLAGFGVAMVLWANGHAGIFTGVLMLAAAAVGLVLAGDRRGAARAAGLAATTAAAAFATPAGTGVVRYLALHLVLPRIHTIDEFRRATWRSDAPFFVGLAVLLVVVTASVLSARGRAGAAARPRAEEQADDRRHDDHGQEQCPVGARAVLAGLAPDLLPVVAMAALGVGSVRFAADAALVAAPLVAARATALGAGWRARRTGAPSGDAPPFRLAATSRAPWVVTAACALALLAMLPRLVEARSGRPFLAIGLDPSVVPEEALRFVEANGLRERMYNDFETGSYLAFEGYPRWRVFVDPRLPAYPEELHRLLGDFDLDRDAWDRAMQRYGVTSALLTYAGLNRRVAWWDPERWALVYRAGDARVFVRRLPRFVALIRAHEIPATFRFTVESGAETLPLDARPPSSPVTDCEWRRRLGDLFFDLDGGKLGRARAAYERALVPPGCLARADEASLAAWLGADALTARAYARAVPFLDRALALEPGEGRTRANRALALEALGRVEGAAADWSRLAAVEPDTALGKAAAARALRLRGSRGDADPGEPATR